MQIIFGIIFFILGLVIGSFLNVVIFRLNTHKTFGGKSFCFSCRKNILWYDLVPLFSYVFLGGKCRHCRSKISWQYPAVELISGLMFLLIFLKFENVFLFNPLEFAFTYAFYSSLFSVLLVILVYDIRHKIIPDVLSLVFGIMAFLSVFLFSGFNLNPHLPSLYDFAGLLLPLPFALLWYVSGGRWMGFGDVKLMVGMGLLLGLSLSISAAVLAFWIGAIVGILMLGLHKVKGWKSEIPFAPFLVLGTFVAFLFNLSLYF
jgi:leader peptidase (prepilin peptidase)/N-methyltransferase